MPPHVANFLFEAANVLVLAAALGWLLFKPVRRWLDDERERRADALAEIESRAAALEAEREALGRERVELGTELERRRSTALTAARRAAEEVQASANATARSAREALTRELERRRQIEMDANIVAVGSLAAATVEKLLLQIDGPEFDLALARSMRDELARMEGAVTVECAHELDAATREVLDAALAARYEVRVVPELGAGLRVLSGSGQIDATALGFAKETRRTLAVAVEGGAADE